MQYQTKKTFEKFKKKNNFSLCYIIEKKTNLEKIDLLLENVLRKTNSFIFESVEKAKTRGRYTIFGFEPDLILEIKNKNISINKKKISNKLSPKRFLENFISKFNFQVPSNLPPMSALLSGYLGYDIIRYFEKIPDNNIDDLKIPDVKLIRPTFIYIHDNQTNKLYYIKLKFNKKNSYSKEIKNLQNQIFFDLIRFPIKKISKSNSKDKKIYSNITKKKFINLVKKAKDIFQ